MSNESKEFLDKISLRVEGITELAQRDQTSLTQDKDRTNERKDKEREKKKGDPKSTWKAYFTKSLVARP